MLQALLPFQASQALWGPRAWSILLLAPLLLAFPHFADDAAAQFGVRDGQASIGGQFIEPDRSLRQEMSDAREAIDETRYGDAIIILGELLSRKSDPGISEMQGQDFFFETEQPTLAGSSLLREAENLLGQLPSKGMEIYDLRYGSRAAAELKEAVEDHDWQGIAKVSREYLHTDAGLQATLLLGYHDLVQGRPLAAALMWDRVYRYERLRNKLGANLIVALAGSWYQAGNTDRAVDVLVSLNSLSAQRVPLDGREVDLPKSAGDASVLTDWLSKHFPKTTPSLDDHPLNQPLAGGNAARNGYRGSELPMRNERWMKQTTWSVRQQEFLESFQAAREASGTFPIPTWQPIVVDNTVLAKTTEGMVAIDFESGKYVWEYPWFSDTLDGTAIPTDEIPDDEQRHRLLVQRVWNDLPFGRVSSDGTRAFMLMDLGEVRPATFNQFGGMGIQGIQRSTGGTNTLVALDIATEGKLVWTIGGEYSAEPQLDDTFFLGPPLPIDDQLYVIGEQKADLFLFCLDSASGALQWRQHLVAVETGTIEDDPIRRIGGAVPAYADGTLVCPTGHGAIVAIDLATRTFRWGFRYPRTDMMNQMSRSFGGRGNRDSSSYLARWNDGTPLISQGRVLVTPIEGDRLYALDLQTGKPAWATIPREDWHYLAGVADGTAILVGNDTIRGLDVTTGNRRWDYEAPLTRGESIVGRGAFGPGQFMFPTSGNRLVSIGTLDGRERSSQEVHYPLGNLVSVRGQLLSQSATHIAMARGRKSAAESVASALLVDPNNVWATICKGELLLEEGNRDEALQWLRRVPADAPEYEEARVLIVEAMVSALRSDFAANVELLDELERVAELPQERAEVLRLKATGLLESGDFVAAAQALLDLSAPEVNFMGVQVFDTAQRIELSDGRTANLDGWIGARVDEVVQRADSDALAKINELVAARLQNLSSVTGPRGQQLQRHFGHFEACDPILLAVADRFRKEGSYLAAERLLRGAIAAADSDARRDRWLATLAGLYLNVQWETDALATFAEIKAPEAITLDDNWGRDQLKQLIRLAAENQNAGLALADWPKHANAQPMQFPNEMGSGADLLDVMQRDGLAFANWKVLASESTDSLQMQTPQGTLGPMYRLETENNGRNGPEEVYIDHGMMIVVLPSAVIGIDLFQAMQNPNDMEVWRRVWRSGSGNNDIQTRRAPNVWGQLRQRHFNAQNQPALRTSSIQGGRFMMLQARTLSAVDVLTGKDRWRATLDVDDGYLAASDSIVSVVSPSTRQVFRFRSSDGQPLETESWIEPGEQIWATNESRLLTYTEAPAGTDGPASLKLRLWDATTGKPLIETQTLPAGTKGQVVENRFVVTLQPEGDLQIWDLKAGKALESSSLPPGGPLLNVQAMLWEDRLIVLPNVELPEDKEMRFSRSAKDQQHVEVAGPAMAFDLATGKPLWEAPFQMEAFGVTLGQPVGGPLMFLSRRQRPTRSGDGIPSWNITLQAIDVRDGRLVHESKGLVARTVPMEVVTHVSINPTDWQYIVAIDRNQLSIKMQDEPPPKSVDGAIQVVPDPKDGARVERRREPFGLFQPVE
ncbi:outer membrane biogenesis protein BamB [Rosistilla carotiformis]|uniref:Outer membrane biogenesis protein BamB n=1 Tax=Rosistilla carotiformis TaxID=2528017 RepID=A0A518JS49_9BACT|nr:PQQ-binding-like beta-propeller repeat protein [Rosistilla carotiformis]QDV68364.1 outer membrane biogenesis protein BamB [Rosistilla carotiformis]